jgi:hypothetical protein
MDPPTFRPVRAQRLDEVGSGPRDAGPDGPDGAVTHLRRLLIGQVEQLREDQRAAPAGVEVGEQQ